MADVLLGRAEGIEGFERHVVLKRIRPEHAKDQRFIRMFIDEARLAANLHHQHIVQVHDVGESGGEYFIAMEYIHGEDVRTLLSMASKTRAHAPLGYAIAIVSAAAAGLHYAHERRGTDKRPLGIVHRDVSPSNILVGYDGSIKVVDFGIAKAASRQETRSGSLKGKVSYMSPEQCRSDDIDRRSDVYSLGVVLYELATTTRLFRGENDYLVMDQIVNGRISLPRVRRPDLPNELSAIIMRALATDPERRFFTADELRVALEQFAMRAGLTASTSAIASYMRKQFGEKPEPWLELGGSFVGSLDDVPAALAGSRQNSWTEMPRLEDVRRSGPIARPSTPVSVSSEMPPVEPVRDSSQRLSDPRLPATQSPTDSKMGWESHSPPAPASRGLTPAKLAMICAPLVVLLGFAIWRFAGTGSVASPAAAVAAQQPAAAAQPAPVVTPIQVPTPAPMPVEPPPEPKVAARAPEPSPPSKRSSSPPPKRAPTKVSETAPSPSKPETPSPPKPEPPSTAAAATPPSHAAAVPVPAPGAPSPGATPSAGATSSASTPGSAVATAPPAPATPIQAPIAPSAPQPLIEVPAQLSHTLVERVASDHSRELTKCEGGENLHGDITVQFMVDANGKVTKAQIATALKKQPKLTACILRAVQKWQFGKQGPTGALGTYTLSFQ